MLYYQVDKNNIQLGREQYGNDMVKIRLYILHNNICKNMAEKEEINEKF